MFLVEGASVIDDHGTLLRPESAPILGRVRPRQQGARFELTSGPKLVHTIPLHNSDILLGVDGELVKNVRQHEPDSVTQVHILDFWIIGGLVCDPTLYDFDFVFGFDRVQKRRF